MYVSHISEDGRREEVRDHLREVSEMAAEFASFFGAKNWAEVAGSLHDIGKCSREFQNRILSGGSAVDHSTAGAYEAFKQKGSAVLSFCIAGHHGGLLDGGTNYDIAGEATLAARIKKAEEGRIPAYDLTAGIAVPDVQQYSFVGDREPDGFSISFLTRMIFSCLVDADYLCTERFMEGQGRGRFGQSSLQELCDKLEEKIAEFYPPQTPLNRIRCKVLNACAEKAPEKPGVFSLTVPTGGGKTYASLRFALRHATAEGRTMRRVIYAVPYTSIIGQNAEVFRRVLGEASVLEHHASFDFDSAFDDDGLNQRLRLMAQNWDAPVVVTTNVQFFESLFASKTSRCRKLHNIAGSVIVLDEAQMLPTAFLEPCVRALAELVHNYGCSVVLCTATQPVLNGMFAEFGLQVQEIASDVRDMFQDLRRVSYAIEGQLMDGELVGRMLSAKQVLCVVNSRKQARILYDAMVDELGSREGVFHLSTYMHPVHREEVLARVRRRLDAGLSCRLVATSLIEAGVDVDFPAVYRALAGIDSIVQCAGRCNREGKHSAEESIVHIFEELSGEGVPYAVPRDIRHKTELARNVLRWQEEDGGGLGPLGCGSVEVIERYFLHLLKQAPSLDERDACKKLGEWKMLRNGIPSIPFEEVAASFKFIEDNTSTVVVPDSSISADIHLLREGMPSRGSMRRLARFGVDVYENEVIELCSAGAVEPLAEGVFLLLDESLYRDDVGFDVSDAGGRGLFF